VQQLPAIAIVLKIESMTPEVFLVCENEAQKSRLLDWIRSQDELAILAQRAIDLAEEARAA
jgi:hypothetical protein